jgi:hypothetical protein
VLANLLYDLFYTVHPLFDLGMDEGYWCRVMLLGHSLLTWRGIWVVHQRLVLA